MLDVWTRGQNPTPPPKIMGVTLDSTGIAVYNILLGWYTLKIKIINGKNILRVADAARTAANAASAVAVAATIVALPMVSRKRACA